MNFSLRTLLIIVAGLSVLIASLVYVNPFVGDIYYTLGLLTIGLAIILAVYRSGPNRAYWVGFLILFGGYFCHTVWPSEIRTTWLAFSDDFGMRTPGLITNRLLALCFEGLHGGMPDTGFPGPRSRRSALAEQYVSFLIVGHTAIAALLGCCGGLVARKLVLHPAMPIRR
jgi:hypothetical protein